MTNNDIKTQKSREAENIWYAMRKAGDFVRDHNGDEEEIVEDEAVKTEISVLDEALSQAKAEVREEERERIKKALKEEVETKASFGERPVMGIGEMFETLER